MQQITKWKQLIPICMWSISMMWRLPRIHACNSRASFNQVAFSLGYDFSRYLFTVCFASVSVDFANGLLILKKGAIAFVLSWSVSYLSTFLKKSCTFSINVFFYPPPPPIIMVRMNYYWLYFIVNITLLCRSFFNN